MYCISQSSFFFFKWILWAYIVACVLRECEPKLKPSGLTAVKTQQTWDEQKRMIAVDCSHLSFCFPVFSGNVFSIMLSREFRMKSQQRFSKSVRYKMTKWHVLIFSAVLVLLHPGSFQLVWSLFLSNRHSICDIKQEREVKLVRYNSQILFVTPCEGGLQGLLFFKLDERENGFKVQLGDKDEQSLKRPCCLS